VADLSFFLKAQAEGFETKTFDFCLQKKANKKQNLSLRLPSTDLSFLKNATDGFFQKFEKCTAAFNAPFL
tara:strand:+ start:1271 stop:1480 length:210 start_codon:yes stop_codon:yes gene_type:complete